MAVRTLTSQTTSLTSSLHGRISLTSYSNDVDDPFRMFLVPPPGETSAERKERERIEADARRINDEIDQMLRAEKAALRKKRKTVKVLLLGQSESGKSTTLKNFQLKYAKKAWQEERSAWRAVVQLNLCRTVNFILNILTEEMAFNGALASTPSTSELAANNSASPSNATAADQDSSRGTKVQDDLEAEEINLKLDGASTPCAPSPYTSPNSFSTPRTPLPDIASLPRLEFDERHSLLMKTLAPLKRVQRDLEVQLGAGSEDPVPALAGAAMTEAAPFGNGLGSSRSDLDMHATTQRAIGEVPHFIPPSRRGPQEFFVRSTTGWKSAFERLRSADSTAVDKNVKGKNIDAEETTRTIAECRSDIEALWNDNAVRLILARRRLRLEESGGFFLNDVERIAALDYEPNDNDIVRARLRTMGVQEHRFKFERGADSGLEWVMYDVGGTRSLRAAWPPFFDDVNAIIFLAPISCFDEKLAEDRRVNRLEDSFLLWKAVCTNKLLRKTMLILFLNKCDLLEKKLNAGVEFKNYVSSFGKNHRGRNDVECVAKYLKGKFRDMMKQHSTEPRGFFVHLTSVIDTKATAITLVAVREGILRDNLRASVF